MLAQLKHIVDTALYLVMQLCSCTGVRQTRQVTLEASPWASTTWLKISEVNMLRTM